MKDEKECSCNINAILISIVGSVIAMYLFKRFYK